MPTIVGPYSVADDTEPGLLTLTRNAMGSVSTDILALEPEPGRVALTYTGKPPKTPDWAWGFSTDGTWINPVNPDEDKGIIYTNVHEYGHQWWKKFGSRKLRKALRALGAGTFGDDYASSFSEYFADSFARVTTGGRFKTVLAHFYTFRLPLANYPKFLELCVTLARKPDELPDEPDEVIPPLEDPIVKLTQENALLTVQLAEANSALVVIGKVSAPYLLDAEEPVA